MQNMVRHIDGCHIPLYENLIKGKNMYIKNIFITKKISILY